MFTKSVSLWYPCLPKASVKGIPARPSSPPRIVSKEPQTPYLCHAWCLGFHCVSLQLPSRLLGQRGCFHGHNPATMGTISPKGAGPEIGGWVIVRKMLSYVWPKDKKSIRVRVVLALSLLIGAKVRFKTKIITHLASKCPSLFHVRLWFYLSLRKKYIARSSIG